MGGESALVDLIGLCCPIQAGRGGLQRCKALRLSGLKDGMTHLNWPMIGYAPPRTWGTLARYMEATVGTKGGYIDTCPI